MRGDTGVDGGATEETRDEAQFERDKAREQLLRGRAHPDREFLTWGDNPSLGGTTVDSYPDAALQPQGAVRSFLYQLP